MNLRQFSLWSSLVHALTIIVFVPIAVGWQIAPIVHELQSASGKGGDAAPSLGLYELAWEVRERLAAMPPSLLQLAIAAFAGAYYTMDLIIMWANVHPLTLTLKLWYTVHHIACTLGLTMPALWHLSALDTVLAFGGFWSGEISNPPRCLIDLVQGEMDMQVEAHEKEAKRKASSSNSSSNGHANGAAKAIPALSHVTLFGRRWRVASVTRFLDRCQTLHLVMFIAFRFVGTHYMLRVVYPSAQHAVTNVAGIVTLLLSLMAVVAMLQGARANNQPQAVVVDTDGSGTASTAAVAAAKRKEDRKDL